ncbi:MAG: hypothetical protein ACR2PT_07355 [Endozoicomonas sp.]
MEEDDGISGGSDPGISAGTGFGGAFQSAYSAGEGDVLVNGLAAGLLDGLNTKPKPFFGGVSMGAAFVALAPNRLLAEEPSIRQQWEKKIADINNRPPRSAEWIRGWYEALQFALSHTVDDYHFFLNAAIALTKLGRFAEALSMLEQAESKAREKGDHRLLYGVRKQRGFILYLNNQFFESLEVYRSVILGNAEVSSAEMYYLRTMMTWLTRNYEGVTVDRLMVWYDSLTVRCNKPDKR